MTMIRHRDTCRLCRSPKVERVVKLAPTPVGEGYVPKEALGVRQEQYPVDLYLCRDCGNLQLGDVLDPSELYRQYIYKTGHSLGLVQHFDRYAEWVLERFKPVAGSQVVDLGSNDGSLLRAFKARGMKVAGVDPAADIAAEATAGGIPTYPDFFTVPLARKIRSEHGPAALITMNNAFANIDDLHEIVNGVRELLADTGVFIFETGYGLDVLQKLIFDNIYHEHLSYFAARPLRSFLASQGLELIDIYHVPTKGGSIRCAVQRKPGPRPVSPSVARHVSLEEDARLFEVDAWKGFAASLVALKANTLDLIRDLKRKGRTIAGYGASVTVTGVLFNFDLDESLLDYLVDDNPVRHGLHSPGMHIPVFPSERLNSDKPDYVVILAWQYARPIMARHRQYLENGGRFLVFQPWVRVIHQANYEA